MGRTRRRQGADATGSGSRRRRTGGIARYRPREFVERGLQRVRGWAGPSAGRPAAVAGTGRRPHPLPGGSEPRATFESRTSSMRPRYWASAGLPRLLTEPDGDRLGVGQRPDGPAGCGDLHPVQVEPRTASPRAAPGRLSITPATWWKTRRRGPGRRTAPAPGPRPRSRTADCGRSRGTAERERPPGWATVLSWRPLGDHGPGRDRRAVGFDDGLDREGSRRRQEEVGMVGDDDLSRLWR